MVARVLKTSAKAAITGRGLRDRRWAGSRVSGTPNRYHPPDASANTRYSPKIARQPPIISAHWPMIGASIGASMKMVITSDRMRAIGRPS